MRRDTEQKGGSTSFTCRSFQDQLKLTPYFGPTIGATIHAHVGRTTDALGFFYTLAQIPVKTIHPA